MRKLLSESGEVSTTRVIALLINLVILGVWAWVSIEKKELQPLSIEQLGAMIAGLTAKVLQKSREQGGAHG